jgi:hypothetical protein
MFDPGTGSMETQSGLVCKIHDPGVLWPYHSPANIPFAPLARFRGYLSTFLE